MSIPAPVLAAEQAVVVEKWASLPYDLLVEGESGTGKTMLAAHIHALSARRDGPFVPFSMARLDPGLHVAELCGARKGGYTSSDRDHPGLFEQTRRGTLALDEFHHAALRAQGVLLELIESRRVRRMMEARVIPVDVRLILITKRRVDILPLARAFLQTESARVTREPPRLGPAVQRLFLRVPWPGNIRELKSVCQYLVGNCGEVAELHDLPGPFLAGLGFDPERVVEPTRARVARALVECKGNKTEAARRAGITRQHLHRVIKAGEFEAPTRPE